jgi:hypothetical protein
MARRAASGNSPSVDVHARTTMVILEIVNDNSHYVNGVMGTEFPLTLDQKYTVSKHEEMFTSKEEAGAKPEIMVVYTIELDTGIIKVSNYRGMLQVDVNAALEGTAGMMGSQEMVGMVGRDKQVVSDANEMGAAWQVRDDEVMLFHEVRAPQYPQTCTLPIVTGRRNLRRSDNELKVAEAACAGVADSHRHFCVEDALLSGDIKMAHAYRFRS